MYIYLMEKGEEKKKTENKLEKKTTKQQDVFIF